MEVIRELHNASPMSSFVQVTFSTLARLHMRKVNVMQDQVEYIVRHVSPRPQGSDQVYLSSLPDGRRIKVRVNEDGVVFNVIPIQEGKN